MKDLVDRGRFTFVGTFFRLLKVIAKFEGKKNGERSSIAARLITSLAGISCWKAGKVV